MERHMTANGVAEIAKTLQDAGSVHAIPQLEEAYAEIALVSDLNRPAAEVHRSIVALKALRENTLTWQIRTFAQTHPWYSAFLISCVLWALTTVVMLRFFPLKALLVSTKLARLNFTFPAALGGFTVPLRNLFFLEIITVFVY
jgi:hypothetical protein